VKLQSRSRLAPTVTTGSMADVSFLLVIFFMVTTVLSVFRGLDLALPEEVDPSVEVEVEHAIDVHVIAGGALEVDGRTMALNALLGYVADKLADNPRKPVILRTDSGATYADMQHW